MFEMNLEHKNTVRLDIGVKVINLRLLKGIHVFMYSSILRYDIYSNTLKLDGITTNTYDRYKANSTINVNKCTIAQYVDKNKVSHIDEEVNTKVIQTIAKHFGILTVSRVKQHRFLLMYIELLTDGKLSLFMKDYTQESIGLFGEDLSAMVLSLVKKGLQNINEGSTRLEKKDADILQYIVAKLIYG